MIFTDDMIFNPGTGKCEIAFFIPENEYRFGLRVSDCHSIETLELQAIQAGIKHSIQSRIKNVIILSDARRMVEAFEGPILGNRKSSPLINDTIGMLQNFRAMGLGYIKII